MINRNLHDPTLEKVENTLFRGIIIILFSLSIFLILKISLYDSLQADSLKSTIKFIKEFNFVLSVLAVLSCLISYNRLQKENIFIISLMYLGLSTGILFGQIDYLTFLSNELYISDYIAVSSSLLRIGILLIIFQKNTKIKQRILTYKKASMLFVVIFTIVCGFIEKSLNNYFQFEGNTFFIAYNSFLLIVYTLVSINLFISGFKEKNYLFPILSSSIFMLAIKALYAIYAVTSVGEVSLTVKLGSVSITYLGFLIVIAGNFVDLFLNSYRIKILNNNLALFYNLAHQNKHSYMCIMDDNWNVVYANQKIQEFYHETDLNQLTKIFSATSLHNTRKESIIQAINQTGTWRGIVHTNFEKYNRTLDCCMQVVSENDGKKEIAITYLDISEEINKELELEKLKVYDKEKSAFITNLSHELKTPLNVFCSVTQLLDQVVDVNDQKFKQLYMKYRPSLDLNAKRMTKLINNLMDMSKIEIESLTPNFHNYDIIQLIQGAISTISHYPKCQTMSIQFETDIESHLLKCDSSMIERILSNLLSNAIKFSTSSNCIIVRASLVDHWFVLEVEDFGIGINSTDRQLIFERFVQVDKSFTKVNEGIGMGLTIVHSLVHLHGGKIDVESDLQKGSTFKILIPNQVISDQPPKVYVPDEYKIELEFADIRK